MINISINVTYSRSIAISMLTTPKDAQLMLRLSFSLLASTVLKHGSFSISYWESTLRGNLKKRRSRHKRQAAAPRAIISANRAVSQAYHRFRHLWHLTAFQNKDCIVHPGHAPAVDIAVRLVPASGVLAAGTGSADPPAEAAVERIVVWDSLQDDPY